MRSMVEGARFGGKCNDGADDRIHVSQHISRGNAHHSVTLFLHDCIAGNVPLRLITQAVPFAINFDDQPKA